MPCKVLAEPLGKPCWGSQIDVWFQKYSEILKIRSHVGSIFKYFIKFSQRCLLLYIVLQSYLAVQSCKVGEQWWYVPERERWSNLCKMFIQGSFTRAWRLKKKKIQIEFAYKSNAVSFVVLDYQRESTDKNHKDGPQRTLPVCGKKSSVKQQ